MLGTFRWSLSIIVTLSHLWFSPLPWWEVGVAAVFGFFLISGYLMTSVINRTYSFTPGGVGRYALNRFLRVYPAYWFVLILAIPVVMLFAKDAYFMNPRLALPHTFSDWLPNILILGLLDGPMRVLVPPAWSLDIELVFYVLMGLGLSRSRPVVLVWFLLSAIYTVYMLLAGVEFAERYSTYAGASLPFSIGAMTYMYRDVFKRHLCLPLPVAATIFAIVVAVVRFHLLGNPMDAGFYLILCCTFLLLISLNNFDSKSLPLVWRKFDKLLGDLAYPVFLCHWMVGTLVLHFVFASKKPDGGALWMVSIVVIHILSLFVYYLVDHNVNRLRDKVRGAKRVEL